MHTFTDTELKGLRAAFRGPLITPEDAEYDQARQIWDAAYDRRPTLIARCLDFTDVVAAVDFAREYELHPAVRGGGHSPAGHSVCDDDMVIDLGLMRSVHVDPRSRRVWADGGAIWADVDRRTQEHGLATPGGQVSHTGIGGLTLCGGFGYLTRKFGLTADNVTAARIVTADGRLRTVDETRHPDLFWAIRGGGGNFGVVTAFQYQLHPVGPTVLAGTLMYPAEQAADLLRFFRDVAPTASDDLSMWLMISNMIGPSADAVAESTFVTLVVCWLGSDLAQGEAAIKPIREFRQPLADTIGPMQYADLQHLFDEVTAPRRSFSRRSGYFDELTDSTIEILVDRIKQGGPVKRMMELAPIGNGVTRVPPDANACGKRAAGWLHEAGASWEDPDLEDASIGWVQDFFTALEPVYAPDRLYLNAVESEGEHRVRQAYSHGVYERLAEIKRRYDPANMFRRNHNIRPA